MPEYDLGTARGKIELDASQLGRASAAFTGLGKGMVATGALAVGAFAYAVKSAADFEKIMSAVGAVTNATSAEMAAMKEQALDLGASTVYGADQIGRAMEQLAKAGITIPDILGGATEATVTFAAAAGDELAGGVDQAAVVMANAMKTFGAGADELDHFADVLVGAAASSTLSVDDIATSMTYAGPIAATLGLSIDDLSTALAILGDRGIRGSTAGTSLRGVLLGLTTQTPKATEVMKDLGLITADGTNKFFDMNGALKPMPEVMELLGNATKDLSEEEKIAAFNAIFQRRAMNSAMILAEQGAAGFDKYAAAIAKIKASDVAAKKLDNLTGDITLLKNSVETMMIRVGLPLQDMLRGWVQALTDVVSKINEVNPELLANIAMWVGIGGAVLIAAGGFLMMVGVAFKLYRNFILLKEAVSLLWAMFKLLTLSLLTNPWFLLAAAIVAIGVALYAAYQHSDKFRERVDALWQAFQPVIQIVKEFVENFVTQFGNLIEVLKEGDDVAQGLAEVIDSMFGGTGKLVGPIRTLVKWILGLWDSAKAAFGYFADVVLPLLMDFAGVVASTVGEAIMWFIDEGIPAIEDFAAAVVDQIGMAIDWFGRNVAPIFIETGALIAAVIDRVTRVLKFFAPFFTFIWDTVTNVLRAAGSLIESVVESILMVWDNFKDNILRIIVGAWQRVKQTIESFLRIIRGIITLFTGIISGDWGKAWDGIKQIVSGVWAAIGDVIQNAWFLIWNLLSAGVDLLISLWEVGWNTVADVVSTAWDFVFNYIKDVLQSILGFIINNLNLIKNIFISIWNTIVGWFGAAFHKVVDTVRIVIGEVVAYFRGLWGKITGAVGNLAGNIYNFFRTAFREMWSGAVNAWSTLSSWLSGMPGRVLRGLGNMARTLYDAGKDIIDGLWNGMKDVWEDAKDWVGGLGGKIVDLKGPPETDKILLTQNGKLIMDSLKKGLEKGWPGVSKLLSQMSPSIAATVTPASALAGIPTAASGNGGGTSINVTFEFPNVTSAEDAAAIEGAIGDSTVMSRLVSTLKAGRR